MIRLTLLTWLLFLAISCNNQTPKKKAYSFKFQEGENMFANKLFFNVGSKSYYISQPFEEQKNIISKVGDTFIIIVRTNASNGYLKQWIKEKECEVLSFISKKHFSIGDEKCEGCGAYEEYKFSSKKAGECFVKIGTISMRSQNKDTLSIAAYKVVIKSSVSVFQKV